MSQFACSKRVIVTSGPTQTTPFQDDSVCLNATVNPLTVTPGINGGTPTYQWFVNSVAIPAPAGTTNTGGGGGGGAYPGSPGSGGQGGPGTVIIRYRAR